ncbi:hypothetical protein [Streptomyces sp. NBC_00370]
MLRRQVVDVARAAGVTRQNLSYEFAGKDSLARVLGRRKADR